MRLKAVHGRACDGGIATRGEGVLTCLIIALCGCCCRCVRQPAGAGAGYTYRKSEEGDACALWLPSTHPHGTKEDEGRCVAVTARCWCAPCLPGLTHLNLPYARALTRSQRCHILRVQALETQEKEALDKMLLLPGDGRAQGGPHCVGTVRSRACAGKGRLRCCSPRVRCGRRCRYKKPTDPRRQKLK